MLAFIGSSALNAHLPREQFRKPNDIDAIADYETACKYLQALNCDQIYPINGGKTLFGRTKSHIYEIEIAWPDTSAAEFLELLLATEEYQKVVDMDTNTVCLVPSLNILYTLKMSHRYLRNSPFFLKTRNDILFMRTLGARIPQEWSDWYKTRQRETYHYEHPNLDRDKSEFFVDLYQYDHDSIHEAVALEGCPAYTYFNIEGKEVLCSKEKFFACDEYVRLCAVVEESMVLALERSLIPHPGVKTEEEAFLFALMKVCTSITSGWFREYAWEHYDAAVELFKLRNTEYPLLERFNYGLRHEIVKQVPNWPV